MRPTVPLRKALNDPQLLGGALPGPSWRCWRVLLIAAMGEPLTRLERQLLKDLTGREEEPGELVEEFWAIVGRRGGKTRAAGALAAYIATLCDHSAALATGERGVLPILAASVEQATRVFQHVAGILRHSPMLAHEIEGEPTSDTIRLRAGIDISIRPANFRTIRGITAIAAIGDELAFWSVEGSSNPDREILDALRPALATTGGPLIVISSPYARRGELWNTFKRHYGAAGDKLILVAKGASMTFNPTLKPSVVDRAYERDAAVAASEYGGEFRTDVEAFISQEVIDAATDAGCKERLYHPSMVYYGFVDAAGGSGQDSMTMAIAHNDGDAAVLDVIREARPPFSPDIVVEEYATLLKSYGLLRVTADKWGSQFVVEAFAKHGIACEQSAKPKSDIYKEALPLLNSGKIRLLDNPRLIAQLVGLERRTARGGRDSIDHPPGGHDDVANSACGVLVAAGGMNGDFSLETYLRAYGGPEAWEAYCKERSEKTNVLHN